MVVTFELPDVPASFGISVGENDKSTTLSCWVHYKPVSSLLAEGSAQLNKVAVECGKFKDTLQLLSEEKKIEIRIFSDWTFIEAYFQKGRVVMTASTSMSEETEIVLTSTTDIVASSVSAYPMKAIWVTPDEVRKAPRVYNSTSEPESMYKGIVI